MPARQFLFVSDAVSPLVSGGAATAVMGFARGLTANGASVVVLSLASPDQARALPGFARRLRTVKVKAGDATRELAFYEGKAPQGATPRWSWPGPWARTAPNRPCSWPRRCAR